MSRFPTARICRGSPETPVSYRCAGFCLKPGVGAIRVELRIGTPRKFLVAKIRNEVAARVRQEAGTLVVEDAEQAGEQEVVLSLPTGRGKPQDITERVGMEEPPDPDGWTWQLVNQDSFEGGNRLYPTKCSIKARWRAILAQHRLERRD